MTTQRQGIALVLNCGSSSIKYQVVDTALDAPLASGLVERVTDHNEGVRAVIESLSQPESGVDLDAIDVVGHRVVQGGSLFTEPTVIDDDVQEAINGLSSLAPLHNPANVAGIAAARAAFPGLPHVAIFDTAFHATLPAEAYTYAIDRAVAEEHGVRRYGFHGTSHAYVSRETAALMGKDPADINVIVLHLGNGASASAVQGGISVDTSMGLTPLEGLVMGTRSGDIDPAVVVHLGRTAGMDADQVDHLLNRESGMLGLTGHSDMRDVADAASAGDAAAELGLRVYARRIKGYVGNYFAQMGGLDAIVFTAGVGENDDDVRLRSMRGLGKLGIVIDEHRNAGRKKVPTLISADDSPVQIWVVPTNEEREIALQSLAVI